MIFIALLFILFIFGLVILFLWTGRALRPTPRERMERSKRDQRGPRATGLN